MAQEISRADQLRVNHNACAQKTHATCKSNDIKLRCGELYRIQKRRSRLKLESIKATSTKRQLCLKPCCCSFESPRPRTASGWHQKKKKRENQSGRQTRNHTNTPSTPPLLPSPPVCSGHPSVQRHNPQIHYSPAPLLQIALLTPTRPERIRIHFKQSCRGRKTWRNICQKGEGNSAIQSEDCFPSKIKGCLEQRRFKLYRLQGRTGESVRILGRKTEVAQIKASFNSILQPSPAGHRGPG